ncbi:DUF2795 domain-containing protein [Phytoactinopolyspora mesophila]|uniref:DUF2795 domain-containing protein n=1 Tax=Phytoactinopolyspora mesophila TaxID=2650750 RepID=A0A7K3LYE8_9ACTN|nr:DUF2795 domain-containing protein [Phytoactinopolyspora mesophila]NDL55702.1 DUF2795 domain-containing protein [Phytoactinopolyspora mesophila]
MNVARSHIAAAVQEAFHARSVGKADLLAWATANRAPVDVLQSLNALPDITYRTIGDLWPHLPDLPDESA